MRCYAKRFFERRGVRREGFLRVELERELNRISELTLEQMRVCFVLSQENFSSTWGGGVKVYPNPRVGFSVMARFTPTYIKSDPSGVWCGYYGCYVLGDAQYANQFEFSGGLSLRF